MAPQLLGLADPLALVLWKNLQVQLQTAGGKVSISRTSRKQPQQRRRKKEKKTTPKPLYWALIGGPHLSGRYLPAYAAKAAAPQPAADACLPDPGQVITVEEQVIPFFPAGGRKKKKRFMSSLARKQAQFSG